MDEKPERTKLWEGGYERTYLMLLEYFVEEYFDQNPISQCSSSWSWAHFVAQAGLNHVTIACLSLPSAGITGMQHVFFSFEFLIFFFFTFYIFIYIIFKVIFSPRKYLDSSSKPGLTLGGYFCPQCSAKYGELPVECKICGLTLVSAPHLVWSYHHLFPLDAFQEIPLEEYKGERFCYGCQGQLKDQHVYVCTVCQNVFCVDCDVFVHDSLHFCPGCIHKIPIPSGI
ncbi:general transcription factor IIH subunit 2-like protein [Cavia porcellus]|uniref:general transcription factor IIH subunit 2-like protein n=1 Tax=Cavia porcellus TaxID=10141 RepID=UPI002FE07A68